ncbi:MAG: FAD-dependent oxidoreductase [Elusimicrobiota bacterium]
MKLLNVLALSRFALSFLIIAAVRSPVLVAGENKQSELLVETESFQTKGGWVVDPQFVEQMGSPYLLAHGLGISVANAKTEVRFPSTGKFFVWAHTKNWAPGQWDAPGRFKLIINGVELPTVLGTAEKDNWFWQYAGEVEIKDIAAKIELADLTGFDGRCDAIYFCTTKQAPPENLKELLVWRNALIPGIQNIEIHNEYDVVIIGGGIAGCAAAIAAAEQGLNVALIHDRPVLGGNASEEVRVHTSGITGNADRIISGLNTKDWKNGSPQAKQDDLKRHKTVESHKNIHLYLNYRAFAVDTYSNTIKSVDAKHVESGKPVRFVSPFFIDCTGDGWIGYWAGAEYMYGREPAAKYNESWDVQGDFWSPVEGDNRVMGSSLLWRSTDTINPAQFPDVPWATIIAGTNTAVKGDWNYEYSSNDVHQVDDAEFIRDHLLRGIYGTFSNAKKVPVNANRKLEWVGYILGKRESRRLVGDYIFTFNDIRELREFPDTVVIERRPVDVHHQRILKDPAYPDFLSKAVFFKVKQYNVPYRSLYSKNITNLFMAGRCFSCTHIALGGPRVMNTTGQMGVAVGYAASLCKKYKTTPRGIYQQYIEELKTLISKN